MKSDALLFPPPVNIQVVVSFQLSAISLGNTGAES
jgi:hypothetical protein